MEAMLDCGRQSAYLCRYDTQLEAAYVLLVEIEAIFALLKNLAERIDYLAAIEVVIEYLVRDCHCCR